MTLQEIFYFSPSEIEEDQEVRKEVRKEDESQAELDRSDEDQDQRVISRGFTLVRTR
jgi:hypothetical protein